MMDVSVLGADLRGPGLADWDAFAQIVRGEATYVHGETPTPMPAVLTARERRRASNTVKLALTVAAAAVGQAGTDPASLAAVFGSSQGEAAATHELLLAMTSPQPFVSPTVFHNSVHNTAAGYWSIGVHGQASCDSIAAGDSTFGATLLTAITFAVVEDASVLMVVHDAPMPDPLAEFLPIADPFAAAVVVSPRLAPGALCRLQCKRTTSGKDDTPLRTAGLEPVQRGNPAARSLMLLEAMALQSPASMRFACADDLAIQIDIAPC
jgi:hypothetical protein